MYPSGCAMYISSERGACRNTVSTSIWCSAQPHCLASGGIQNTNPNSGNGGDVDLPNSGRGDVDLLSSGSNNVDLLSSSGGNVDLLSEGSSDVDLLSNSGDIDFPTVAVVT